jgi:hypothetical protein
MRILKKTTFSPSLLVRSPWVTWLFSSKYYDLG